VCKLFRFTINSFSGVEVVELKTKAICYIVVVCWHFVTTNKP